MSEPSPRLSEEESVQSIQDALTAVILRRGWALEQLEGKQIWSCDLGRNGPTYRCFFQVEPDSCWFIFYVVLPYMVPEHARPMAAMALAEINYGLAVGKFELDLRDGELRFSNGIDVSGTRLDEVVTETMVDHALAMVDAYASELKEKLPMGLPV
jgi:hypothetical protein